MPKPLKFSLAALGGLFALLLGVVIFIVATFDPNAYKPLLIETVMKERQRTLAIPGPIKLTLFPRLGVKVGEVTLSERNSTERFASIESAQVSLALLPLLKRQVVVDRVTLAGLRARIVRSKDGKLSIDDLTAGGPPRPAEAPAQQASPPFALDIAGIVLADAEMIFDDRQAPRRLQLSKLSIETGRIAPGVPTPVSLKGRLETDAPKLGADLAAQGRLQLGPAPGRVTLDALEVDIDAKLGTQALKIRLTGAIEADTEAGALKMPRLEIDAKLPNPKDAKAAPLALAAKGTLALKLGDKGRLDAKLAGQFDESRFSATVAMPRLAPAAYTFDAEIDRLDVDRYLGHGSGGSATPAAGAEKPLDLSALRDLDASGQLRIGALQAMNLKASQVRAGVRAGAGRLTLSPLTAELYQGRLAGSASVSATTPVRVALQQNLEGIAIGPLLKDLSGNDALQGRGNVTLDLGAASSTAAGMMKSLAGSARLELKDGAVRGVNVAQAIRSAKSLARGAGGGAGAPAAMGGSGDGKAAKGDATDFSELSASFRIAQGVARNDDLAAKSPLLRVAGSGDIDLGASRIDYTVRATIVPTLEGQGGAELQALRGQTVPVKLSGPFSAIGWRIDFAAMAKEAAQSKIDEKREALKEDAKRRLGDKLRGLLGK